MIDKQEFYHGAALSRLLSNSSCCRIRKVDGGYIVNDAVFLLIKYTTKHRSPWRFTFSNDDMDILSTRSAQSLKIIGVFINGGDGISVLTQAEINHILGGRPGWVSMSRRFNQQYSVAGSENALRKKCSLSRFPTILFVDTESCLV